MSVTILLLYLVSTICILISSINMRGKFAYMRVRLRHRDRSLVMCIMAVIGIILVFFFVKYNDDNGLNNYGAGPTPIARNAINSKGNMQAQLLSKGGSAGSLVNSLGGLKQGKRKGILSSLAGIAALGGNKNFSMANISKYAAMSNGELRKVYSGLSSENKSKVIQNKDQIKKLLGR